MIWIYPLLPSNMKWYTLITWASSGIWYAFAEICAKNNNNLVLVARSAQRLWDIKKLLEDTYKIQVYILVKDITLKDSPKEVYEFTKSNNLNIENLINNAWFWDYGEFSESDPEKDAQMIQLNIITLTSLTRYYVTDMKKNNHGKILNVASTAAFQPGPYMAVYFATKAYVSSFSLALSSELAKTKITVTTLYPGPTKSSFVQSASAEWAQIFSWKLSDSYDVASYGYKSMMRGKRMAIYWALNKAQAGIMRFIPMGLALKAMNMIMKKQKKQ